MYKNIKAEDSWNMLKENKNSFLVDVRCEPEWQFIGVPDLSEIDKKIILISWSLYPFMDINKAFADDLISNLNQYSNDIYDAELIFICRTGGRSASAAEYISNCGFNNCYNLEHGFEGPVDNNGHRGLIDGWKAKKLPWRQS